MQIALAADEDPSSSQDTFSHIHIKVTPILPVSPIKRQAANMLDELQGLEFIGRKLTNVNITIPSFIPDYLPEFPYDPSNLRAALSCNSFEYQKNALKQIRKFL